MHYKKLKYCFTKLLVFVLAFQILNISVQSGAQSTKLGNNASIGAFNQIDCFVEFFCENICAIKDYNDAFDLSLHNKLPSGHKLAPKFMDIQMPVFRNFDNKTFVVLYSQNHYPLWDNKYDYLFEQEITPPPPKTFNIV